MSTNFRKTIWAMALLFSVGALLVISSCSEDEDPTLPPNFSYTATTVEVGTAGSATPAYQGDPATFEITDYDGADAFVSINSTTGIISITANSTAGEYDVKVKATNGGGSSEATAKITVVDPVIAPGLSYEAATVAVGSEGTVTPAVTGDAATYEITSDDGATFVSIDASTGVLTVAKESKTGTYSVAVKATNAAGTADATAELTIGANPNFDPVGKKFEWTLFMNRTADITLVGLDGVPNLPITDPVTLPTEWPTANTPVDELWQYGLMTGIQELLLQVPGDEACGALDPSENGDTLLIIINADLTVSTVCTADGGAVGTTVPIGVWEITFAEDKFMFTMQLDFLPGLSIPYQIDDAKIELFQDVYSDPANPTAYDALQGTVINMTTPTDLATEETIQDFTKWSYPNVDVVLRIIE
jgi:hypothetical protein